MLLLRIAYQPFIELAFAVMRGRLASKYTEGFDERTGLQSPETVALLAGKRPLWVHCVSVGEVQAAMPLLREAKKRGVDFPVILSTTTETGKAMAYNLGVGCFDAHIYYPWDRRKYVSRALDTLNPWGFVTAETELWPNMLWELKDRHIPSFLINGRISDRMQKRASTLIGGVICRELYSTFSELFMRDETDAARVAMLGIEDGKIHSFGDTKIDSLFSRRDCKASVKLSCLLGEETRPTFIAGSTHPGEDEIVIKAFRLLRKKLPEARLIIAPRHPERAGDVAVLLPEKLKRCLFSKLNSGWDVLVVDKIGILFELYSLVTAAFIGGSFADRGGQNILEPAAWGVPVQYGPHMEDFAEVSENFLKIGLADIVNSAEELAAVWLEKAAEYERGKYSELAKRYFSKRGGASSRAWDIIEKFRI